MQLFYEPTLKPDSRDFTFNKEESRHIVKVLRKTDGDKLLVTNGEGGIFECQITLASDNKCSVKITKFTQSEPPAYSLHLAVAPTKMNDRYEWFLEKATEIGVTQITPIICEHSERRFIKEDRFEKILLSAMKQSGQYFLPNLNPAASYANFMKQNPSGQKFIAHCIDSEKKSLKEFLTPEQDVVILIGPEGDFSALEVQQAIQNDYLPVTLGTTRLRTETAAIVACHSVAFVNQ